MNIIKQYNIIYADPPWKYNDRNTDKKTKFGGGVHAHYPTMTVKEICDLDVKSISDDNCALFLWVTFPRLKEGLKVMDAWGFEYKTIAFNWFKTNKDGKTPFFGVGYYAKSNTEICLLGIKGKMKPITNAVSQVIIADEDYDDVGGVIVSEREKHSKKPNLTRDKIVELFGDVPRVELFARQKTVGWDVLGFDVGSDDIKNII